MSAALTTPVTASEASPRTLEEFLAQQRDIDLLRFITCGSVDDGKSTLIGRLLHDTRQVFDDQLSAVANDSRRWGTTGEVPDLALLVDGLQAEREQGITIDVAYRYFSTPKRKFIVADCPGHEQYTRNMATGASTAEAAVVLVDAEKGIRVQTRRHTHIVALLGVQNIILAVNKMDRIAYDRAKYEAIAGEFVAYAHKLGVTNVEVIPVGALHGVNVVHRGTSETPWYNGRTLLEALEGIEVARTEGLKELRFPIQLVSRPDANFRGYAGTIASGEIAVGDSVLALPSRKSSKVREITTADGPLEKAGAAQAVTVVLEDEIDLSRGDVLVHPDHRPTLARTFDAHLIWMGEAPLLPGKRYEFKIGARYVKGLVDSIQHRIDVNDLIHPRSRGARSQRPRARAHRARRAGGDRRLQAEPRDGLVHHHRPAALRHRRRRHGHRAGRRRAREHRRRLAADARHRRDPREPEEPEAVRVVVHRALGRGQVHARERARAGAGAPRPPLLSTRRRQRAPRPQQGPGLLRRRSQRKHPPHRRGVGAVRGCGTDRDHRVHLAVPRRPQPHPRAHRRRAISSRSTCRRRSRNASAAIRRACT